MATKEKLFVNRNPWEYTPSGRGAQPIADRRRGDITADHVRNFLDCCRSRKLPTADAAVAAISIIPPLLAVESYLKKKRIQFDPVNLDIVG
jgi:hypothetical protein